MKCEPVKTSVKRQRDPCTRLPRTVHHTTKLCNPALVAATTAGSPESLVGLVLKLRWSHGRRQGRSAVHRKC